MTGIKLNGTHFKCASCLEELKVKHYLKILKEWDNDTDIADRDYFKLLNILTDGKFSGYDKTIENDITIFDLVGWVITQPLTFEKKPPKGFVFEYQHRPIPIPEDISELTIGQNIHLRRDYIDKSTFIEENIAISTAIYLQPIIDGKKFNIKRAEEICREIENMPVHKVYPLGFFLANRAKKFGMPSALTWSRIRTSLGRTLRKMFPFLLKSNVSTRTTT
jgi:hypothetical protein